MIISMYIHIDYIYRYYIYIHFCTPEEDLALTLLGNYYYFIMLGNYYYYIMCIYII